MEDRVNGVAIVLASGEIVRSPCRKRTWRACGGDGVGVHLWRRRSVWDGILQIPTVAGRRTTRRVTSTKGPEGGTTFRRSWHFGGIRTWIHSGYSAGTRFEDVAMAIETACLASGADHMGNQRSDARRRRPAHANHSGADGYVRGRPAAAALRAVAVGNRGRSTTRSDWSALLPKLQMRQYMASKPAGQGLSILLLNG